MYTQCPDCGIAFKVTADVLKQAAGLVRCGGCSKAFNALEYLSEEIPEPRLPAELDTALPELLPEPANRDIGPTQTISAEQSAAFLKTLDELAGSDIRIEDTGVEWRVLDDDLTKEPAADDDFAAIFEPGNEPEDKPEIESAPFVSPVESPIDEFLDDAPTPVDQFLTDTPSEVEAAEIFEEPDDDSPTDVDLLRFDDDTPLPAEFSCAPEPEPELGSNDLTQIAVLDEEDDEPALSTAMDPDIALTDPDEWTDILDEVGDVAIEADDSGDEESDQPARDGSLDITPLALEDEDQDDDEDRFVSTIVVEEESAPDPFVEQEDVPHPFVAEDPTPEPFIEPTADEMPVDRQPVAQTTIDEMPIDPEPVDEQPDEDDAHEATVLEKLQELATFDGDDPPGFETIIMEGERVHSGEDLSNIAATSPAPVKFELLEDEDADETTDRSSSRHRRLVAGAIGLALLLAAQVVHQSREALATHPVFEQTVAPIYRALGKPVQPSWDVTGWQIEVSQDVTDRVPGDAPLTVYSRIGNRSGQALPYPLVWISLTDRFAETVGSEVVEPARYLSARQAPDALVAPGETFEAVMAIESPTPGATGFKLDICYRVADGRMRCAVEDFR